MTFLFYDYPVHAEYCLTRSNQREFVKNKSTQSREQLQCAEMFRSRGEVTASHLLPTPFPGYSRPRRDLLAQLPVQLVSKLSESPRLVKCFH